MNKKLIKLRAVQERTTLARSTIYKYMAEGLFPKRVQLGKRNVAWDLEEVESWIRSKLLER